MVYDLVARPVEPFGEPPLREGHADRVADALAERAGRRLGSGDVPVLRVPCGR